MTPTGRTLQIRHAPHLSSGSSVDAIMFNVVIALVPIVAFSVFQFGLSALMTIVTSVAACAFTEWLLCRLNGRPSTTGDWSATVTGVLYGLTLPPSLPVWMVIVGSVFAIGLGKFLFGGLGSNPFNPALVGRALLQATFPVAMTSWPELPANRFSALPSSTLTIPFTAPQYDGLSGATPLARWKFDDAVTSSGDLFLGTVSGSTGETSSLLILLGGAYLVARGMMNWRIPLAILLTVATCSIVLYHLDRARCPGPVFMVCSGGLMLGAVFMATDPVGSPMTDTGCILYGILTGLLVVVIRVWAGIPEGVMYAILLSNAVTPHIDNRMQPRAYGTGRLPDA